MQHLDCESQRLKMNFQIAILVLSDKCSKDSQFDQTTPVIKEYFSKFNQLDHVKKHYKVEKTEIVPDNVDEIRRVVTGWSEADQKIDLILTSGGTGFTDNDCTPEAIKPILHREAPGIVHRMLSESFKITPFAMMSRPVAGTRNNTLIITLPGSPKGALENLEAVIPTLGHALSQIGNKDSRALHLKLERTLENAPPGNGDRVDKVAISDKLQHTKSHHHHHHHHHNHNHNHGSKGNNCGLAKHELISNDLDKPIVARARSSPFPMVSMDEAFSAIKKHTSKPEIMEIDIRYFNPAGYVIAEDIYSTINVPEFRASIVDGYAVKSSDGPGTYPVVSISHASPTDVQHRLSSGEISRVTTGAPVPLGSDAVIMVEETQLISVDEDGVEEKEVQILAKSVKEGDNIREVGSDIKKGELIFSKGFVISLSGGECGMLSSIGISSIKVFKKSKIGILSTGDELVDTFQENKGELHYGQIYDSNRPTLLNAVKNSGYELVDLKIAADDKRSLEAQIRDLFSKEGIDYLITTGGVSMGELDLLKPIIERKLNGVIHFGRVKMKPGKPTTFATIQDETTKGTIFALPGNPASAAVCFYLFVLPSLRLFSGYQAENGLPSLPVLKAKLLENARLDPRPEYQRVHLFQDANGGLIARNTGFQRSSRIASFRDANSLVILPSREEFGGDILQAGSEVDVLIFGPIGGYR